jgi:ribosomal protein L37AE/L43A
MYSIKTMELKMMECPKCGNPMPVKRRELGYHVCVNCSTESAKRGVPVMRGTGDHTWVDLEVLTQEQFDEYKDLTTKPSKRTKQTFSSQEIENEDRNLQGPLKIIDPDEE